MDREYEVQKDDIEDLLQKFQPNPPPIPQPYSEYLRLLVVVSEKNSMKQRGFLKQQIKHLHIFKKDSSIFCLPIQTLKTISQQNRQIQKLYIYLLRKLNKILQQIFGQGNKQLIKQKIYTVNIRKEEEDFYQKHIQNKSLEEGIDQHELKKIQSQFSLQCQLRLRSMLIFGQDRFQKLIFRCRQLEPSVFWMLPIPNKNSWRERKEKNPLILTKPLYHSNNIKNLEQFKEHLFENLNQNEEKKILEKEEKQKQFLTQICQQILQYEFLTNQNFGKLQKDQILYSVENNRFFLQAKQVLLQAIGRSYKSSSVSYNNGAILLFLLYQLQQIQQENDTLVYKKKKKISPVEQLSKDEQKIKSPLQWLRILYKMEDLQIKKYLLEQDDNEKPNCKNILLSYLQINEDQQNVFQKKKERFPPTVFDIIHRLKLKTKIPNVSKGRFELIIHLRWRIINKLLDMNQTSLKVLNKVQQAFNPKQFKNLNINKLKVIEKQMKWTGFMLKILWWIASGEFNSIADNFKLDTKIEDYSKMKLSQAFRNERDNDILSYVDVLIKKLQYISSHGSEDKDTAVVYSLILKRLLLNYERYLYTNIDEGLYRQLERKYKKNYFRFLVKISKLLVLLLLCLNSQNIFWAEYTAYPKVKKFIQSDKGIQDIQPLESQIKERLRDCENNKRYEDGLIWGDVWLEGNQLKRLNCLQI